ncbi:hypothetical protein BB561_003037 [Smittium simulii]|uniref:Integrator complex subunit 7 N-terminal domain-containing protein n=1 Tax=Smittium simulii TaxID=133385 RepID=A0A2T9YNB5_9FUNG|nr:hypothetical protein BB561_003037 [Smittium simulii]
MEISKNKVSAVSAFRPTLVPFSSSNTGKHDPTLSYSSFQLDDIKLSSKQHTQETNFNSRNLTKDNFGLSDKIVTKLVKLETESRNNNSTIQFKAILGFSKLLDDFPFPVVANSAFLKLADLFRNGTNNSRMYILKVFEHSEKHLFLIQNAEELIKRILTVLDSNDPVARSLTLRLLGSAPIVFSSSLEVQYKILHRYQTENLTELKALIDVTQVILAHHPVYLEIVWNSLKHKLLEDNLSKNIKSKILCCMKYTKDYPSMQDWTTEWCKKFIVSKLETFFDYSHNLPIDYAYFNSKKMLECELFVSCLATWGSMLGAFNNISIRENISIFVIIIKTCSKKSRYLALLALYKILPQTQINMLDSKNKELCIVITNLADQVNDLVLAKNNLNSKYFRKESYHALKVLAKCYQLLGLQERFIDSTFPWILFGLDLNISNVKRVNKFSDCVPFNLFDINPTFQTYHSAQIQLWKIYIYLVVLQNTFGIVDNCIQHPLAKPQINLVLKSATSNLIYFGLQTILYITSNFYKAQNEDNTSKIWIMRFIKISAKTIIGFGNKETFIFLAKHLIGFFSVKNQNLQYYSVIALEKMAISSPMVFLEEIQPMIVNKLHYVVQKKNFIDNESVSEKMDYSTDKVDWCLLLFYLKLTKNIKNISKPTSLVNKLLEFAQDYIGVFIYESKIKNSMQEFAFSEKLSSDVIWWLFVESCSAGQWVIISMISQHIVTSNISPSSRNWWNAMLDISFSQISPHKNFVLNQNFLQAATLKLRLICQKNQTKTFQYNLILFHYEATSLLEILNTNNIYNESSQQPNPCSSNNILFEKASVYSYSVKNICKLLETCKKIQFSHINIDKYTLTLLKNWETTFLDIITRLEKSSIEDFINKRIEAPLLILGSAFTQTASNIHLEIDTSPEIPNRSENIVDINNNSNQKFSGNDRPRALYQDNATPLNAPLGSQFFVQILGLVSRSNSLNDAASADYDRKTDEKPYSDEQQNINSDFLNNINNYTILRSNISLPITFINFKANVWLSYNPDKILPNFMVLPSLKNLHDNCESKTYKASSVEKEIVDYISMNDYTSNTSQNFINQSIPWNEYMDLPVPFSSPLKAGYFNCTVSVQLPPKSAFYNIYKPLYAPDLKRYKSDKNNAISLGQMKNDLKVQVYMHILCSMVDNFNNVWYIGPHLVFPLVLY